MLPLELFWILLPVHVCGRCCELQGGGVQPVLGRNLALNAVTLLVLYLSYTYLGKIYRSMNLVIMEMKNILHIRYRGRYVPLVKSLPPNILMQTNSVQEDTPAP